MLSEHETSASNMTLPFPSFIKEHVLSVLILTVNVPVSLKNANNRKKGLANYRV